MTAAHTDFLASQGVTSELVREPLPLGGGFGWRLVYFLRGVEIKGGQLSLVEAMRADRAPADCGPR